jgi:hypothetical protein
MFIRVLTFKLEEKVLQTVLVVFISIVTMLSVGKITR